MKTNLKLLACMVVLAFYKLFSIILLVFQKQNPALQIISLIVCLAGLIGYLCCKDKNPKIAIIPLGVFIIGSIFSMNVSNLWETAKLYEFQKANSGIFYLINFICDYVLINAVIVAIMINKLLKNKHCISIYIVLIIIMLASISTAFYHVPINPDDLSTVGLKILGYYVPIYIFMQTALLQDYTNRVD